MEHRDLLSRVAARFAAGAPRASQRTPIGCRSDAPLDGSVSCIPIPCIFSGDGVASLAPPSAEERPSPSSP
jgi:hypothetical protein